MAVRKGLTVAVFVLALVLVLLVLTLPKFKSYFNPMSVHDRVTHVVQNWAGLPSVPTDNQELEVVWAKRGGFAFFPYAAQNLATSLQTEFKDSRKNVIQFTDISADANPKGKIKTVRDLATAVRQNYEPQ